MLTVKRCLLFAGAFAASSVLGPVPAAEGAGAGVCTITGTMNFMSLPQTPEEGQWRIEPAVIHCHGVFNRSERYAGPASFTGEGTYTTAAGDGASCVHHVGFGTVEYLIRTSEQDIHIVERHSFVLAGGGSFTTPTLRGSFQVTPTLDGDGRCLTEQVTRTFFVAQGLMVRTRRPALPVGAG